MSIGREPASVRIGRIVYGGLLAFYPPEFRRKFGEEMLDVFLALLRDAVVEGRAVEVFSLWRSGLWELLVGIVYPLIMVFWLRMDAKAEALSKVA